MSTKPIWPKFIKGSNGERTNKYKGASLIVSSIGISLSLLLTIAYSNCGKMKTLDFNSSNPKDNFGAELFGTQSGSIAKDHLEGTMSFGKSEIRQDESTNLSWGFNWGSSDSTGYRLQSFGCNQEVFGGYIKNMQSFLNVSGGCDNKTGACSYHADGDKPVSGLPPSTTPYSCEIKFQWFNTDGVDPINDVKIAVSIKVNPKPQDPPPPAEKCEGSELLQGNFERCNDTECVGWAFEYGQVATKVQIRAIQRGEKSRNVTIMTTTTAGRSDVNSHLAQQGCLNTGSLLSQFTVSKSTIDAALRAATASTGPGSGSNIQLEAVVVGLTGGRSIGFVENYQPLSPIDPVGGGGGGGGTNNPPVSTLSFVSGPYNVGITGSAENFPADTKWCLTTGNSSCVPTLANMQDWASTGPASSGRFNWKYEVRPYQVGWCPGTFTAVMQAPNESAKTASFTIGYPNFYAATGGLQVYNVPPPAVGTLKGCFEYDQNYGPANAPGSCNSMGQTPLINNGWSYNESTHSASFNGDSSVFGGRHGTIFFTFDYNCGLSQPTNQSF